MSDYTPTTEQVRDFYVQVTAGDAEFGAESVAEFDRWLAERDRIKQAEAWEEGALWQRANHIPNDRRMRARFVSELVEMNPYREGAEK